MPRLLGAGHNNDICRRGYVFAFVCVSVSVRPAFNSVRQCGRLLRDETCNQHQLIRSFGRDLDTQELLQGIFNRCVMEAIARILLITQEFCRRILMKLFVRMRDVSPATDIRFWRRYGSQSGSRNFFTEFLTPRNSDNCAVSQKTGQPTLEYNFAKC